MSQLARAQDAGAPVGDDVRQLMHDGLERELPRPSTGKPEWPRAEVPPALPALKVEPGSQRIDAMAERVRLDASTRARAGAEEKQTTPDNLPAASQSRTKAAKANPTPPTRPIPPRP
jgi:hypothetical protein